MPVYSDYAAGVFNTAVYPALHNFDYIQTTSGIFQYAAQPGRKTLVSNVHSTPNNLPGGGVTVSCALNLEAPLAAAATSGRPRCGSERRSQPDKSARAAHAGMMGAPQIGPIATIWPSSTPPATGTSGAFPSSAQASVFLSLTSVKVGKGATLKGSMFKFKSVPGSAIQYLRNFTWTTTKTFYGVGSTGKVAVVPYQKASPLLP